MRFELAGKLLKALKSIRSTDVARPLLHGFNIHSDGMAEMTNGHVLLRVRFDDDREACYVPGSAIDSCRRLSQALDVDDSAVVDRKTGERIPFELESDPNYPLTDRLFRGGCSPEVGTAPCMIVDPKYLRALADVADGLEAPGVRLTPCEWPEEGATRRAIYVTFQDVPPGDVYGLLMPRVDR